MNPPPSRSGPRHPSRGSAVRRLVIQARTGGRLAYRSAWHGFVRFYNSDDLTFASSIAYYALLSLFPFLLLALSIFSHLTASDDQRRALLGFVFRYFPRQFEFVSTQLEALARTRCALGVVGSLVMVWAALGVFGAVTSALNHAWRVERQPSYFKHKLVSFVMLFAAGVLLFLALALVSFLGVLQTSRFGALLAASPTLQIIRMYAAQHSTTLLLIMVVGLVYYFVPNTRVRFRDVWPGAVLAGVLWRLALLGFQWYVRDLSRFTMIHGSIAAVVVFLVWVYVSAVILLYGAEFTAAYARLRRGEHGSAR
jgi:membrane protein